MPVRGQVVRLAQFGLDEWTLDAAGPTYVVPRSTDVVVGGTDDEDAGTAVRTRRRLAQILDRAAELVPGVAGATVLSHRVGTATGPTGRPAGERDDAERRHAGALLRPRRSRRDHIVGLRR